jgi:CubicO group peptidase (beta-lactamase class C family)
MTSLELEAALGDARIKHGVPGVSAAVFEDGRTSIAASGLTNVQTGVTMTPDAIMHIGSITKTINATILMQLVEEGKIVPERRVLDYWPEFRLGEPDAAREITVEMLVNHTSGIDGTLLPDLGHDEETLEKTVHRFAGVGQVHAPNQGRSYCNAGTVIAGYLSQRLTGKSWYDLVKERIIGPLGLEHSAILPEDALLHRASAGHFRDPATGGIVRSSHMFLLMGYAPAGATAMTSAGDLLTFLRTHLADGVAPNGTRLLSIENSRRMRQPSGTIAGTAAFDCGIAWIRNKADSVQHGGGGPGIVSFAFVHPPSQTAAAVLTNAEHGVDVLAAVINPLAKRCAGFEPFPLPPAPSNEPVSQPERYVGTYENSSEIHEVMLREGRLSWSARSRNKFYDSSRMEAPPATPLVLAADGRFLADRGHGLGARDTAVINFSEPDAAGRMQYLIQRLWLYRRVAS